MLFSVLMLTAVGQEKEQKRDPMAFMVVKTYAMCNMCKEMLERDLIFEKGIHKATVDMENFEIMVDYNPKKTDKDKVRAAIAKMGVQADDVPADKEGIKNMPACCQNEGCGRPGAETPAPEKPSLD